MVDIQNVSYRLVLLKENGEKIELTRIMKDLEIEEGENQWSEQVSFYVPNIKHEGVYISSLAKLNCVVFVYANWSGTDEEIFRGTITDWEIGRRDDEHGFTAYAYDNTFYMQKNQDNRYFSEGTGTRSAIESVFSSWNIPLVYNGPNEKHAKVMFKNKSLSSICQDLLDDAVKKGGIRVNIRSVKGTVYIQPRGINSPIYHFSGENTTVANDGLDMKDIITRVKVVGEIDDEGRSHVDAVLDKNTEFGIHQKVYNREQDDSLDDAKIAAAKILDASSKPSRTSRLEAPDLPFLRKWDCIHVEAGTLNGNFWITEITHYADSQKMKMRVIPEGDDESDDSLASVLQGQINRNKRSELLIDFGSIQDDMSLRTNTFPDPIPQGDYSVCRQLTLGETNTPLTVTACDGMHMHGPSGPHGHGHANPSGMNGEGGGAPAPIANPKPTDKNTLISPAVQKAFDNLKKAAEQQGEEFGWADFQKMFPNAVDPQFLPEDDGAEYPTGTGSPPHLHPKNDVGSKHRHPADSRETHTHVTSPESNHVHVVLIPEKMRWLHPGDRVLVAWVRNQPCVIDLILNSRAIG